MASMALFYNTRSPNTALSYAPSLRNARNQAVLNVRYQTIQQQRLTGGDKGHVIKAANNRICALSISGALPSAIGLDRPTSPISIYPPRQEMQACWVHDRCCAPR